MGSRQRTALLGFLVIALGAVAALAGPGHEHPVARDAFDLAGILGLGVGGSILASALVARLVARQVFGIDVGDAIEALRGTSALVRSQQSLEVRLSNAADGVRITAEHRFDLRSSRHYPRSLPFRLYTDVARWGDGGGGFDSVLEPGGEMLRGEALDRYVTLREGKAQFEKHYRFDPGKVSQFLVETYGHFRESDRLIWTVEHLSSDFRVRISDCRTTGGSVHVKVNHHRSQEIHDAIRCRDTPNGPVLEFSYLGEVLPFQGFELQWAA
jgi:hypothetical protein